MKDLARASRINAALQVIKEMNNGMSVVDACQAVGMPRSSFYYIIEKNPETIAELQSIIDANNREQLGLILLSKTELLRKVIEDGLSDTTSPRERLAIVLKLNDLMDRLTDTLQVESQYSKDAREFLMRGPLLVPGKSKFTATERTFTIETEE